jgi:ribosome maturation factor RimP
VGAVCFLIGLGAGRIKFVQANGDEASMDEYWGEPCLVTCKDGQEYEGNLQALGDDALTLEVGEQRFTELPLKDIAKVEVFAN